MLVRVEARQEVCGGTSSGNRLNEQRSSCHTCPHALAVQLAATLDEAQRQLWESGGPLSACTPVEADRGDPQASTCCTPRAVSQAPDGLSRSLRALLLQLARASSIGLIDLKVAESAVSDHAALQAPQTKTNGIAASLESRMQQATITGASVRANS